jgi:hypothetical protein
MTYTINCPPTLVFLDSTPETAGRRVLPMPTATLIRCATWRGGSTSYPSSVAEDVVPSDGGGIGHHQEVVNCNSKDASIIIIPPRMKKTIHKKKPVVKESQPGVKASIRIRKKCSHEGCNNGAYKGGVCVMHGAQKKRCSVKGCTNGAKKGGVCITHGAKLKQCSVKGCTNQIVKGGVCITHGAKRKRCSHEGCTNQIVKGGVCITHGAKVKRCSHEGCTNVAVKGGVCVTHGAKVTQCDVTTRDVPTSVKGEEFVPRMAQQGNDAAIMDVPHMPRKEEYAQDIAQKAPSYQQTTQHEEAKNTLPSSVPPSHQSTDYEDEEELNSWIWKSSRIPRKLG